MVEKKINVILDLYFSFQPIFLVLIQSGNFLKTHFAIPRTGKFQLQQLGASLCTPWSEKWMEDSSTSLLHGAGRWTPGATTARNLKNSFSKDSYLGITAGRWWQGMVWVGQDLKSHLTPPLARARTPSMGQVAQISLQLNQQERKSVVRIPKSN